MSHTVDGESHKALKYMRKTPAAVAVYWDYVARQNEDNISWPSIRKLVSDTEWERASCEKARDWLVEHKALERIEDYIRPDWRDLEPQALARKRNFDHAEYYRPTGYLEVNGARIQMLYQGKPQPDQDELPDGSDVLQDRTSDAIGHQSASEPMAGEAQSLMSYASGHQPAVDINRRDTELDSSTDQRDSKKSHSLTTNVVKDGTATPPASQFGFCIGQTVFWAHQPSGGYGYIELLTATVVKFTAKKVSISVPLKNGALATRSVKPGSLYAEKPDLSRAPDPLADVILDKGYGIPGDKPIPKSLSRLVAGIKAELLGLYPDLTGDTLRRLYEASKFKPNKTESIVRMISDAQPTRPASRANGDHPLKDAHLRADPACSVCGGNGIILTAAGASQACVCLREAVAHE